MFSINLSWFQRLATLVLASGLLLGSSPVDLAQGQSLLLRGGAASSDAPAGSPIGGTSPVAKLGLRLGLTDLLAVDGDFTYQPEASSVGGALLVRPIGERQGFRPYAFVGYGHYLSDFAQRSVVPLGLGLEYELTPRTKLDVSVARQWSQAIENGPTDDFQFGLTPGFATTIGVSYAIDELIRNVRLPRLGGGDDEGGLPPVASAEEPGEEEVAEDEEPRGRAAAPAGSSVGAGERGGEATSAPGFGDQAPSGRPATEAGQTTSAGDDGTAEIQEERSKLPDGTFIMGLTDEDPLSMQLAGRRRVTVSSFYMDRHEVSNADYRAFLSNIQASERTAMQPDSSVWAEAGNRMNWSQYFRGPAYSDYPVIAVTQEQAQAYCEFEGKRLPTEAEWEYSARANQVGGVYPWAGFEPRNARGEYLANYDPGRGGYAADGYAFTAPIDAYPANPWGLYNMSGNVAEWVQDAYTPAYSDIADFNPLYEDPEENRRVVRGGSWASAAFYIGVGVRDAQPKDEASPYVGFRCAEDTGGETDMGTEADAPADSLDAAPESEEDGQ